MVSSLYSFLKKVPDPRSPRKKKHSLAEVLACIVIALAAGQNSLRECRAWLKGSASWIRAHTPIRLAGGVPSLATVSRMLSGMDETDFMLIYSEWVCELVEPCHRKLIAEGRMPHIAIDGKALRGGGTHEKEHVRPPMVMNAYDVDTGLVLAQYPIQDKSCELKGMPMILQIISTAGCMITIDAAGTYDSIMDQITDGGAHFLLQVKDNQILAKEEIIDAIQGFDIDDKTAKETPGYDRYRTVERNRDRNEYREVICCQEDEIITNTRDKWPWVKTYGVCHQVRILHTKDSEGNDTTPGLKEFLKSGTWRQPAEDLDSNDREESANQKIGLVSDMALSAKEMAEIKRDHWKIENSFHHVMDDTFREDHSGARKSRNNLALLRRIAFNVIRLATIDDAEVRYATFPEKRCWSAANKNHLTSIIFGSISPLELLS